MLVLTRRLGEAIVIDGCIRVQVVAIQGDKVRLGIAAPDDVRVDRLEVHQRRAQFAAEVPAENPLLVPARRQGPAATPLASSAPDLEGTCPAI